MPYLPTQDGANHLILDALTDLLTLKLQTEISQNDVSRAAEIKVGPLQATPESVAVLIHENDPFNAAGWPNRPMKFRTPRPTGGIVEDPYSDSSSLRTTGGSSLVGGGSQYTRAYTLEIQVYGLYMPAGIDITREGVRRVASTVSARATKALLEAGPRINTGSLVIDDFGGYVVDGPFMDTSWTDPEESESLVSTVYLRLWYRMALDWSTDDW